MKLAPVSITLASLCLATFSLAETESLKAPGFGTWGFDLTGRDESAKPGDDFFTYANGAYVKRTRIPPDRVRFGNFDALAILSEARVHDILETAVSKPDASTAKIAAFYTAFMDEKRADSLGAKPIDAELQEIRNAATREDLVSILGKPDGFSHGLFGAGIEPDPKKPTRYAVSIGSGGLGLPDKDYYIKPDFAPIKANYKDYIASLLELVEWPEPRKHAEDILAFETRLAEASWERAQYRDRDKTYNPMTRDELIAFAPGHDFSRMLDASGLTSVKNLIVEDKTAFPKKAALFAETPLETLKAWAAFGTADSAAAYLSKPFVDAQFEFRAKKLSGQPEPQARWKRAVTATDHALGEELGKAYVARYFPEESKRMMLALVADFRKALALRIEKLEWMGDATKKAALTKLEKFTVKIGYPDKFRDYSAYQVAADDLTGNIRRAAVFQWKHKLDRLDQPVDRGEWGMPPQKVNAYFNPSMNEIVFPAAILQPPFFDPKADAAVNYGGIGAVIGHEITHGFDDQGRKCDGDGVLTDWWTAEDAKGFEARAAKLGAQYDAFEIHPGEHINGRLTMGENIADMGGVTLALEAYRLHLAGKPAPVLDGCTGEQRIFLSWAQLWRQIIRKEAMIKQLHTDPHSPCIARVNATLRNIDAWYEAFGIQPGDKLYLKPEERVKIW